MRSFGTLALLSVVVAMISADLPSTISPISTAAAAPVAGKKAAAPNRKEAPRVAERTSRGNVARTTASSSLKAPSKAAANASARAVAKGTSAAARLGSRSATLSRSTGAARPLAERYTARAPKAVAASKEGRSGPSSAGKAREAATARLMHSDRGAAAALAGAGIVSGAAADAALHPFGQDAGGSPSIGEAIGLHRVSDPLALRSAVALVVDARSGEVLYEKNSNAVLPIASITKVMMSMVVLDARQPMGEKLTIDETDRDVERSSSSKLPMGSVLTRGELLQLALMSSENRAASALARNYPGGLSAFVSAANRKAAEIGMRDSVFTDGTGLSSSNVSTARDLALMVEHASRYPLISEYSTASELSVRTAYGSRTFRTTNRMVGSSDWDLTLQKTGYISESGNCLVMRGKVDSRAVILVLLDSYGRYSRLGDAQRIRRWLEG